MLLRGFVLDKLTDQPGQNPGGPHILKVELHQNCGAEIAIIGAECSHRCPRLMGRKRIITPSSVFDEVYQRILKREEQRHRYT